MYNDIANVDAYHALGLDYQDLCDPAWFHDDRELAVGFWGDCLNLYRDASPHEGYSILKQWKQRCSAQVDPCLLKDTYSQLAVETNKTPDEEPTSPFFIYTSNVDAHFHRAFQSSEIYEIHGNVEVC